MFLADRGFADTEFLAQLRRLGWHFRIRIKAHFSVVRPGQPACKVEDFSLAPGRDRDETKRGQGFRTQRS